jgi:hypothetical protein
MIYDIINAYTLRHKAMLLRYMDENIVCAHETFPGEWFTQWKLETRQFC